MGRSAAAALLLLAVARLPGPASAQEADTGLPTPWLSRAHVRATVPDGSGPAGTVRLEATYRFRPGVDTARLSAIRVGSATLKLASLAGVSAKTSAGGDVRWRLDSLPGLLRLRVADPPDSLTLTWRARTAGRRLPLFIPETPTRPAESRVLLEVTGGDFDVAAGRVFPRMERADGVLVGRPENLPSFLLLPPAGETFTVDRAADWSVLLLVLVATSWWAAWRRRHSLAGATTDGDAPGDDGDAARRADDREA